MPQVETVILRVPSAKRSGSASASMALTRFSRLSSGSPMPMKTTFVMRPSRRDISTAWSSISPTVRFRVKPSAPVAQKAQPIAQPTWVERQTVWRLSSRIETASTRAPSSKRKRYFAVSPSAARETFSTSPAPTRVSPGQRLPEVGGEVRHAREIALAFSKIHERNWRARYGFWPIFATKSFRASGERSRRSSIADFRLPN